MRRKGVAFLAVLLLPGLALPYARRTKTTIGPPSLASFFQRRERIKQSFLPLPTEVVVLPSPLIRPLFPVIVETPYIIQTPPPMVYPFAYPMPVYSPPSSSSTDITDILFMQALTKMDKELEALREEVKALREELEAPRCPTCGRPLKPEWNLCPYDGTRLPKEPEERAPAPKAKPSPMVEVEIAPQEAPAPVSAPKPEVKPTEALPERPEEAPQPLEQGWVVDWDRNLMRAVGRATLREGRGDPDRARMKALERAYDALREGLLDLWGKRRQEGVDPYQWAAKLVQHAKVVRERQLPDGTWEVEVELKFGEAKQKAKEEAPPLTVAVGKEPPPALAPSEPVKEEVKKVEERPKAPEPKPSPRREGPFTGLVVDAKGLGLKPAMSPKIWDENGRLVWQKVEVSREFVIEHGIVAYARSLEEALKIPRVGKNPLVVKAKGVRGPFKADPVVSAEEADLIIKANREARFLEKCQVVFVID